MGGLTRGAFYHHFKSKEEVLDALSDRMFLEHNPFEEVRKEKGLSGLEKLKKIIKLQAQNQDQLDLNQMSVPLLKNPKILADYMESNLRIVTPFFEELFLEGIQDGSIPDIKYPKALASLFVMITSVWFIPSIVPCTQEDLLERLLLTKHMLDSMGIYLIDDEILQHAQTIVQSIPTK
ncbi:TetR/AcrR family transcriptional regulator [[Clostridium] innocuum]|uniref:TetR/AcrR family transcriptional regulator n=1 Tax=Clostridium innocuum TaxID=1522 RepID=UPI003A4DBC04